MPHRPEKLLLDMLGAGSAIAQFTSGRSLSDYEGDLMLRSAVERQFEILGEALRRLAQLDGALADRIPEQRRIIDFRNVIAHGYDSLDSSIMWQAITEKLPMLMAAARSLLLELDPDGEPP